MPPKKTRHGNLQTQTIAEETPVAEVTFVCAITNDQDPTDTNTEHVVVPVFSEGEGINQQRTVPDMVEPPSWWKQPAPRLQTSDTLVHVQLVISRNFGAGVDMDRFLSPA